MAFASHQLSAPMAAEHTFICMSTVDDLSYTPSAEEQSRDAAQIMATGRRSWKTLKGRGEAVWPPALEAALIEALERYRPDESKTTAQGRFPMRNRFISDYIYKNTGKRRTPKQVGSRLQQLRDTCRVQPILDLLSSRVRSPAEAETLSPSASPTTSPEGSPSPTPDPPTTTLDEPSRSYSEPSICVELVNRRDAWPSPFPIVSLVTDHYLSGQAQCSSSSSTYPAASRSNYPTAGDVSKKLCSRLYTHGPAITLASTSLLSLRTSFSVFVEGKDSSPVYWEAARLVPSPTSDESCGWLYNITLTPTLWDYLSRGNGYTIWQDIHFAAEDPSNHTLSSSCPSASVLYRLALSHGLSRHPETTSAPYPLTTNGHCSDGHALPFNATKTEFACLNSPPNIQHPYSSPPVTIEGNKPSQPQYYKPNLVPGNTNPVQFQSSGHNSSTDARHGFPYF